MTVLVTIFTMIWLGGSLAFDGAKRKWYQGVIWPYYLGKYLSKFALTECPKNQIFERKSDEN